MFSTNKYNDNFENIENANLRCNFLKFSLKLREKYSMSLTILTVRSAWKKLQLQNKDVF